MVNQNPATIEYTFTSGSKYVTSVLIYQSPSNAKLIGAFTIKYWDGSKWVEVSNPSRTTFSNDVQTAAASFSIYNPHSNNGVEDMVRVEFDMVFSNKFQIILHYDDNSYDDGYQKIYCDEIEIIGYADVTTNPLPHIDIPSSYWSRFYNQGYADGSAFSSVANIDTVYQPIAFTADVDLSDEDVVKAFFENNSLANVTGPERYAVKLLEETVLTQAYRDLADFSNVETMVEGGDYQI
eukprot:1177036-Prorocentrum_minimum.AAC.1